MNSKGKEGNFLYQQKEEEGQKQRNKIMEYIFFISHQRIHRSVSVCHAEERRIS